MKVLRKDRWLIVSFEKPQRALSWAIYGGGNRLTQTVAWYQVHHHELEPPVDARQLIENALFENGIPNAIGMLTSASLDAYSRVEKTDGPISASCVATVGMSNALRAGDPPRDSVHGGTINLLAAVSVPLTEEAQLESLSVAVEARTAAVIEAKIPSLQSGLPATGTGTDCVVLVCPHTPAVKENYAGKHTVLGSLIGKAVFEAVSFGLSHWKKRQIEKVALR